MAITRFGHYAFAVYDLILAERFYSEILGQIVGKARVTTRSRSTTEQFLTESPRLGSHPRTSLSGVRLYGEGETTLPLFLHFEHSQEPPPEQMIGTPRIAITVSREQMEKAVEVFRSYKVPFEGPVDHAPPSPIASSLYTKDPSSNFLELCCPRNEE